MNMQLQPDPQCIFCKIGSGEIPSEKIFEDEQFFCIKDLTPQAKVHLLLIPKKHVRSLAEAYAVSDQTLGVAFIGQMFSRAVEIAQGQGLLPNGFRTVCNVEAGGGQSVFHLHLHILAGELSGNFA